jgi:hypothetical protein
MLPGLLRVIERRLPYVEYFKENGHARNEFFTNSDASAGSGAVAGD